MAKAIITVGLGFGDEGKGACVDHLVRKFEYRLVIRYCGGHQAAHNVQLPDGRRHTFSQFGSGTFAGAKTYLGRHVIIEPFAMRREERHLADIGFRDSFGLLSVHPECLVTTPFHRLYNRILETSRGSNAHGSCGVGIGATREYHLAHPADAIIAEDLRRPNELCRKMSLLKNRTVSRIGIQLQCSKVDVSQQIRELGELSPDEMAWALVGAAEPLFFSRRPPQAETVIFEGSQGVLLDETFGFQPYTTWATVTPKHAIEMLPECGVDEFSVLGVIRAYHTRHGHGPLPVEGPSVPEANVGNEETAWRGPMRSGPLNLDLLRYAVQSCDPHRPSGLAVTCTDHIEDQDVWRRANAIVPVRFTSDGPCHTDWHELTGDFRFEPAPYAAQPHFI
jgi:adenylosuccinate synthase